MARKPEKSQLDRAIASRERGIKKMEESKVKIMRGAEAECAATDHRIQGKRVLLDALKRGAISAK
ncbi:MAG TPA: hypothetical protein VF624_15830 [Tepidisphaeraceae bacterium]